MVVWPGPFIFGEDGKDLITLMQEMQAASLKMVTGSYQGTGQSGSSNPNILAAAFTPKAVMLSSGSDAVLLAIPEGDTGTQTASATPKQAPVCPGLPAMPPRSTTKAAKSTGM